MAETYSKYFSLKELTRTDTPFTNAPTANDIPKLKKLGSVLDTMYEKIGPFKIISGYRSPAVQQALKSGGNVQAISQSYHSTGQAADIMPTGQSVEQFFAKITTTPAVKNILGGYAIKKTVIHFDVDIAKRVGVPMYVTAAGDYIRFTASQLTDFIARNKRGFAIGGAVILIVGLGVGAYLYNKRRG